MKIKITTSKPLPGQSGIGGLIGREFDATKDDEDGSYQFHCEEFDGKIVVSPEECEEVAP